MSSDQSQFCDEVFQKDPEWVAPILWKSEFRNVVSLYLRKGLIDLPKALQISEKAEIQMEDRQFHVHSAQVYDFVANSRCSSYDCEFVSLADDLNVKLVTLDKLILSEFPNIAIRPKDFLA